MRQKDHFIPRCYLAAFADQANRNLLHVYSKRTGARFKQKPDKACRLRDGDLNPVIDDPVALRKHLETLEPRWPAHARAISQGELSGDALFAAANMIAYIQTCSPTAKQMATEAFTFMIDGTRPFVARQVLDDRSLRHDQRNRVAEIIADTTDFRTEVSDHFARALTMSGLHRIATRWMRGRWQVFFSPRNHPLITSDYPVAHWTDRDGNVGPGIYFPLRADCGVVVLPSERGEPGGCADESSHSALCPEAVRFGELTPDGAARMNALIAKQATDQVFATSDDAALAEMVARFRNWRLRQRYDALPTPDGAFLLARRYVAEHDPPEAN